MISSEDKLTPFTKREILEANLAHKRICVKPTVAEQAHIEISHP